MKFLPLHQKMFKVLTPGQRVIHNGDNGRQGWVGTIIAIEKSNLMQPILVAYDNGISQAYSKCWFLNNMAMNVDQINSMYGRFNGLAYTKKYAKYIAKGSAFSTHRHPHEYMKEAVDILAKREAQAVLKHNIDIAIERKAKQAVIMSTPECNDVWAKKWVEEEEGAHRYLAIPKLPSHRTLCANTEELLHVHIKTEFSNNNKVQYTIYEKVGEAKPETTTTRIMKFFKFTK